MKKSVFLTAVLSIGFGFAALHMQVKHRFSGTDEVKARVARAQREFEIERLRADVARQQLAEYRQFVATLIPDALQERRGDRESYQLRQLASVVVAPDPDRLGIDRAAGIFEAARRDFKAGLYDKSNAGFRKLIDSWPESVHVPEAQFLLVEGHFNQKDYESCLDVIESMITLFPENEVTGFALIRLGEIYEKQKRIDDAVEIYRTVLASYKNQEILSQARANLKAVDL